MATEGESGGYPSVQFQPEVTHYHEELAAVPGHTAVPGHAGEPGPHDSEGQSVSGDVGGGEVLDGYGAPLGKKYY